MLSGENAIATALGTTQKKSLNPSYTPLRTPICQARQICTRARNCSQRYCSYIIAPYCEQSYTTKYIIKENILFLEDFENCLQTYRTQDCISPFCRSRRNSQRFLIILHIISPSHLHYLFLQQTIIRESVSIYTRLFSAKI